MRFVRLRVGKKGRHKKEIGSLWTYLGGGIVQQGRDDALLEGGQRLGDLFLLGWGREAKRWGYMRRQEHECLAIKSLKCTAEIMAHEVGRQL